MRSYVYGLMTDEISGPQAVPGNIILSCLACLYRGLLFCRELFFRSGIFPSYRLSRPVISVGNITVGGSGKTPLIATIAEHLQAGQSRPVVLMRGYGGVQQPDKTVDNDESLLLGEILNNVPVLVGKDRWAKAREFLKDRTADVFLLDDGFQHRRLQRDLDIVVIDAANPFGNAKLLPRGILREPLAALSRADIFVLTRTDIGRDRLFGLKEQIRRINPEAPVLETVHSPQYFEDLRTGDRLDLAGFRGAAAGMFCSIGHPEAFQKALQELGLNVKAACPFPDHHWYSAADIRRLNDLCQEAGADILMTTAKDAVKLNNNKHMFNEHIKVYVLQIKLKVVQGEHELFSRIDRLLHR